jgi:mRNA interferase MazF
VVIKRGDIWLADFGEPVGSRPAMVGPFVVVQADFINRIRISTVFGLAITSNLALAELPGNVVLEPYQSGLPKTSVVNMTQVATLNKTDLLEYVYHLSAESMAKIEDGLRLVQGLR